MHIFKYIKLFKLVFCTMKIINLDSLSKTAAISDIPSFTWCRVVYSSGRCRPIKHLR
ncbi:unnamed protein product [Nezara viridula]|uniref:Uncharacterized protein n=1 Tax=Nezara viridula TaxID=85310 RepID=A0A9P0HAB5_NEZVI|nr:unnamed protein product [Nezara viridula]